MASEQGPVATEGPLAASSVPQPSTLQPTEPFVADAGRAGSLKRPRESTPAAAADAAANLTPAKFARLVDSKRFASAAPLTGLAAREDELRRQEDEARLHPPDATSAGAAQQALAALRGAEAMSRAAEAAVAAQPTADSSEAAKAFNAVAIPTTTMATAHTGAASPQSATSAHSLGSGPQVVHSPGPMDSDRGYAQPDAPMDEKPASMSYPGFLPPGGTMPTPGPPQRGMSLPMPSSQTPDTPRSPSSKKHKCPYCETEFTRHHNLKSHLLTHSQEKPYVCQDCDMRFRRLHDLKRHSKLHTGEKPHICPKCDRKFARGDALARHSKGAGGCAGRRASMGSFAGDEDYDGANNTEADDSAMAGVVYEGSEADITEEDRRRLSLPTVKAAPATGGQGSPEAYAPLSRSYPAAGPRPGATGGLYPPCPTVSFASGSWTTAPPSWQSSPPLKPCVSLMLPSTEDTFWDTGEVEPLSAADLALDHPSDTSANSLGDRSPSLATQLQQQFARRQVEIPPTHSMPLYHPSPLCHCILDSSDQDVLAAATQAPATSSIPSIPSQPAGMAASHTRTASVPGQAQSADSAGAGGDTSANLFSSGEGLWTYIQALETRLQQQDEKLRLQDEHMRQQAERIATLEHSLEVQISYLTSDLSSLRGQLTLAPQHTTQEAQDHK